MRPVARIAQSVEQGIENPRVLGSIPSPGTTYSENPAYGWVFAFGDTDSPSNYVRLFAASGSPLRGQRDKRAVQRLTALVRVRAQLFREPAQKAGFCFWRYGLSIELRSIIRRKRLTPSGPARQARCSTPGGVSPGPDTTYSENPAYGWVFAFGDTYAWPINTSSP